MPGISHRELYERLTRFDPMEAMHNAVQDTKEDAVLLQQRQMLQGLNAKGEKIGRYKSAAYARKKHQMNPAPGLGIPDLKLSGDLHNELEVLPEETSARIVSHVPYANIQSDRFGNIYGLSPNYLKVYRLFLQPNVVKQLSTLTGLKIVKR